MQVSLASTSLEIVRVNENNQSHPDSCIILYGYYPQMSVQESPQKIAME